MERWQQASLFALLALGVLYWMHRHVWARCVRDVELGRGWRRALTVVFVVLALAVVATFALGRNRPAGGALDPRTWIWIWFGFLFYAFLIVAAVDLVRLGLRLTRRGRRGRPADAPADPGRRALLARSVAGAAALGAGGTAFAGRRAAQEITTPEVEVALARLPRALDGFRIVQLSDVHIGPVLDRRFLEHVVEVANAQRPDLIVLTGDIVDGTVEVLGGEMEALGRLRARHGVAFVTGNHEYYSGCEPWLAWMRQRSIRVLNNERVVIGDAGASFDLAGIPDKQGGQFLAEHEPDLVRTLAGRDPERELVLLAHRPSQLYDALGHGVGLQLSGHTHGGQLWPFGALVALAEPYVAGLHRHGPHTQIYVSRGTGSWGPPLRVANPAEVTRIVLRRS